MRNNERGFFYISGQSNTFFVALGIILLNMAIIALVALGQNPQFAMTSPLPLLALGSIEAMLIAPFATRLFKSMRAQRVEAEAS